MSLDPSERPYGSLFGKRPDLINYGLTGFGRATTPEAWLSTWSGLSSNADFVLCAPGVTAPTLFVELTGDQAAFPSDSRQMIDALGAKDLTTATVRGLHFGGSIAQGEPTGNDLAAAKIIDWLFETVPTHPVGLTDFYARNPGRQGTCREEDAAPRWQPLDRTRRRLAPGRTRADE